MPTRDERVADHASAYNVVLLVLGILLAAATLVVGLTENVERVHVLARYTLFAVAVASAVVGYFKWRNETAFKRQERGRQQSLAELLDAERVRTLTITNGAFKGAARQLQELATKDIQERRREISGFRQAIVNKACDLVRNDSPRSAYFRVEDLQAARRTMTAKYVAARGRTDEFTTAFVEGSGVDDNVWALIDFEEDQLVQNIATEAPDGFDITRLRAYRSYISIPVRAENVAFGMLTINTLEENGFTHEDLAALHVLARLLCASEVIALSSTEWNQIRTRRGVTSLSDGRGTLPTDREAD